MQVRAANGDQGGLSDELYSLQEDRQTVSACRPHPVDVCLMSDMPQLQESLKRTQAELADERGVVEELRALANERAAELELVRKKLNRDAPVNGFESRPPSSPSKHDLAAARDEITGLKCVAFLFAGGVYLTRLFVGISCRSCRKRTLRLRSG